MIGLLLVNNFYIVITYRLVRKKRKATNYYTGSLVMVREPVASGCFTDDTLRLRATIPKSQRIIRLRGSKNLLKLFPTDLSTPTALTRIVYAILSDVSVDLYLRLSIKLCHRVISIFISIDRWFVTACQVLLSLE